VYSERCGGGGDGSAHLARVRGAEKADGTLVARATWPERGLALAKAPKQVQGAYFGDEHLDV